MKLRIVFAVFVLLAGTLARSQSITGTQGQLFIPTAEMHSDRTLVLGAGYIPKGYFQRYNRSVNPGMPTFVTVTFLPFIEVMFRYTNELNMRVNPQTKYYPDRMFAGRIRLTKESKYIPAIVVGANDFTKALGLSTASTNYSATYVVGTKSFKYLNYQFAASLGYGQDVLELDRYDFLGIFGGVEIRHNQLANSSLSLEYDTRNIHLSIGHTFFDRLVIKAGLWDLKKPAAMIAYKYQIW
ncbi:MAG: YjbH domain-containing protein [Bacteroidetes bacterium]|nr:YjbH domain-containing protein [Bacteroidota bacterium]